MKPWEHQLQLADEGYAVLKQHGIVYLACEERTGKSLAALLIVERLTGMGIKNVLIITKKKALAGWQETLTKASDSLTLSYTVTTYHVAYKSAKPDFVIIDEAHNYIAAYPKRGTIWKQLKVLCRGLGIIFCSATPNAQGYQMLFNQLALSSFSPWKKYPTFYAWFKDYGNAYKIEINSIDVSQYDMCKEELIRADVEHLFITKTRADLGFEHEPEDHVHYITLGAATRHVYNELIEHNIVELRAGTLVCDTVSKLRYALHMLEGGVAKLDKEYIVLANDEKIVYIENTWGDSEQLVIMYNYIAEYTKLRRAFSKATILQATSFAEGIDLSGFEHLVIYSQDFSTARHTQRRARQANKARATPIHVHFLLVKKAISEQVYTTVTINKKNFVDSVFKRTKI